MAKKSFTTFQVGDRVELRLSGGARGRIIEARGPLGPNGALIYRIKIRKDPKPITLEVRDDQLILLPPKRAAKPPEEKPQPE